MPLLTSLRKLACCAAPEREEAEARPRPPRPDPAQAGPEPAQAGPAPAGRPYRDFVEREAERFPREMANDGSLNEPGQQEAGAVALLNEPGQQEAGAVALPEPSRARRGSPEPQPEPALTGRLLVVHVVQRYLVVNGFIKPPYSRVEASPNHAEALIQLADEAGWLTWKIPLPVHPDPQHPAIHYTIDRESKWPVPTEKSLIHGDYVYDPDDGTRITEDEYIYPWRGREGGPTLSDISAGGGCTYYKLTTQRAGAWGREWDDLSDEMAIIYYWVESIYGIPRLLRKRDRQIISTPSGDTLKMGVHFSPRPPSR